MRKNYNGIDAFRLFASLLIIAVHTSPLASFSVTGDFILTRVIARIAVPFFFVTSGFFLISKYAKDNEKLRKFVKRTVLIYCTAIIIYIPVNIYNGYFGSDNLLPKIIKDLLFDGTLYHLWYLPAAAVGAIIAWYSVRKLGYGKALILTAVLYLIGLFGDSYYGLSEKSSFLAGFYRLIFDITDYTRNGLFFSPIFFVIGGLISDKHNDKALKTSICGFLASFALMIAEALVLHHFGLQRHDSMYIFLLPCTYFLFNTILHFKSKKRRVWQRNSALIIYIIHPMMILAVRMFAKLTHTSHILIENSAVFFLSVSISSVAFGIALALLFQKYISRSKHHNAETDRAYIEIDLDNLEHNVKVLTDAMPPLCELMAVVKTQAYGHGAFEISTHLEKIGVRAFAVATIDEGITLRKYGIRSDILILGHTSVNRASELKKYDLIQTLIDSEYAHLINSQNIKLKAHIKIDTGMHRLGIPSDAVDDVKQIFSLKNIYVCGMYTHLCCSDSNLPEDITFTEEQIKKFYDLTDSLRDSGITIPKLHIQSSYGLLNYPHLKCSYVRAGVALYGVKSQPSDSTKLQLDLRAVLSLKSRVVSVRRVSAGDCVGYNRGFTAEKDTVIAILPIGYGDGFPRNLSLGNGSVLIGTQLLPVIGRICMDQLAVDITDAPNIKVGDIATLIDAKDCSTISAASVAEGAGSISNELLCRLGTRLPIVVKNSSSQN